MDATSPASTVRAWLVTEWARVTRDLGLAGESADELGDDLLRRWSEPHRRYHDLHHLAAVLRALEELAAPAASPAVVRAAAWFHDAVYAGRAGDDEEASAELAATTLPPAGLDAARADRIAALVRATAGHLDPTREGASDAETDLLLDADLSILGSDPSTYDAYVRGVRAEHPDVDDAAFRSGRARAVEALLARTPLFRTGRGRVLYEERARDNLTAELDRLTAGRDD